MTIPEMIEVIQQYDTGDDVTVQARLKGDLKDPWTTLSEPTWNFEKYVYRIKPKPLEGWAVANSKGLIGGIYDSPESAEHIADDRDWRVVHMQEVVE